MDLINLSYEALHRYFTRLAQSGYIKYIDVDAITVLLYIQEIVREDLSTEEQAIVNKALSCLYGSSCLIPYPNCKVACN